MRYRVAAVLASLALLAAGCGGGSGGGGGTKAKQPSTAAAVTAAGAAIAPASAPIFVSIDTNLDSAQWQTAKKLLDLFPSRDELYRSLLGELGKSGVNVERDLLPALGSELDLVVLDLDPKGNGIVGLAKPDDAAKLTALLQRGGGVVERTIDGWTAFAPTKATLDRFEQARKDGTLDGSKEYAAALEGLPGEAIARVYAGPSAAEAVVGSLGSLGGQLGQLGGQLGVTPPALPKESPVKLDWAAATIVARDDGFEIDVRSKSPTKPGETYKSELASQVPAGALAFVSFKGVDKPLKDVLSDPSLEQPLKDAEQALGLKLDDLTGLFAGEGAFYVRAGAPIPEITLVLQTDDEEGAVALLDKLVGSAAKSLGTGGKPATSTVQIDGVQARKVDVQAFALFYAAFDGKLVVTDAQAGISDLRGDGPRLADDPGFKQARDSAGMPDETGGFAYVDLKRSLPALEGLAGTAGSQPVPPEVAENLAPLQSLFVFGAQEGDTAVAHAFLGLAKP